MKKHMILLFSVLFISSCSHHKKPSITLKVNQTVKIPVQYVTVKAGININSKEAKNAEKTGYKKLSAAVDVLKKLGYKKGQLEINSGRINKQNYRENKPYQFFATIDFSIRDLDKYDTIRRALVQAGMSNFRRTSYHNMKEDSLYDAAYRHIIHQTREKAQGLVKNENVKIGKILDLNQNIHRLMKSAQKMHAPSNISMKGNTLVKSVNPLFHKEYYTKNIRFTVKFALKEK